MSRTHDEISELLGAYALDAVDPDERDAVEEHLTSCPRCAQEVAEHREVAASLAHTGARAPEGVWNRIAANLVEAPPMMELSLTRPRTAGPPAAEDASDGDAVVPFRKRSASRSSHGGQRRWLPVGVAAAAAALVIGLVVGSSLGNDPAPTEQVEFAVASLENLARETLNDPAATKVSLRSEAGEIVAPVAIAPDGSGYLLGTSLPALDESRTYQLWAISDTGIVSVGVLGPAPRAVAFHLDRGVTALAITEEAAGGVVSSLNAALYVGEIS